jgi:hypothetical protein
MNINDLENKYEVLRKIILKKIDSYTDDYIKVKNQVSKIEQNEFILEINNPEKFAETIDILRKNNILFTEKSTEIKTSLLGVAKVCNLVSENIQYDLAAVENEIFKKFNEKFQLHTFARFENYKDYKWVARGKDLKNTYYFKSLLDAENSLENGYIKSPHSIFNVFRWRVPNSLRVNWESPSTIKPLLRSDTHADKDFNYSKLVSKKIDDTVSAQKYEYSETSIGQDNLILQSIKREIKLLMELKNILNEKWNFTDKNPSHKILRTIEYEYDLRKKLISKTDKTSREKLLKKSRKLESNVDNIISNKTKYELSSDKNWSNLMEKLEGIEIKSNGFSLFNKSEGILTLQNTENSKKEFEVVNELLFPFKDIFNLISINEEFTGRILFKEKGTSVLSPFVIDTTVDSVSDIGTDSAQIVIAQKEVLSLFDQGLYYFYGVYSAGVSIYAAIEAAGGANAAKTLNQWIDEIKNSDVINDETKELITDHLKSKKTHTLWGECIGNSLLSAGQIMTIIGCPIWGVGAPLIVAGSASSLIGVGITVANKVISGKKFDCVEKPNEKEFKILNDNQSILQSGVREGESFSHANLRWKVDSLKNESSSNENRLYWISVLSEIIKNCDLLKKQNVAIDKDRLAKQILKRVSNKYALKHTRNMQKYVRNNASEKTIHLVKKLIEKYLIDTENFYNNILNSYIMNKGENGPVDYQKCEISKNCITHNDTHYHPKFTVTKQLIDNLKKCGLWNETERNLIKRLVIKKKSEENIRGSYFKEYIKKINITENRIIYVPPIVPFRIVFRSPISSFKNKTVYTFDDKKFIEDLSVYSILPDEKKSRINQILESLLQDKQNSIGKTIRTKGEFNAKSDVYRPLWLEIPQLIHRADRQI